MNISESFATTINDQLNNKVMSSSSINGTDSISQLVPSISLVGSVNPSECDTSSMYSTSVSSVESLRDRTHLTLDFKGMKPRSNGFINNNNEIKSTMPDSIVSPLSLPRDLLDSILSSPEKILQLPQNWKTAVASGIKDYQTHLQTTPQSITTVAATATATTIAETPTPTKFIYPKNVTRQQEIFAEGFQKALQKIQSDNKFAPLPTPLQPTCSPSTIKYLLSLLTPIPVPQQPQQQSQQSVSSLLLSSPSSINFFNSTLQQPSTTAETTTTDTGSASLTSTETTSAIVTVENTTVATFNGSETIITTTTSPAASIGESNFDQQLSNNIFNSNNNSNSNNNNNNNGNNNSTERRKLSKPTNTINSIEKPNLTDLPALLFNSAPVSTSAASHHHQTLQSANAAVVAAVAAAVAAVSPTTEPLKKSPRLLSNNNSTINNPSSNSLKSVSSTTVVIPTTCGGGIVSEKNSTNLFNDFCKLDPNNTRYMEFLHQQQQLSVANFAPNFSTANSIMDATTSGATSVLSSLPLNFGQDASTLPMGGDVAQQHLISTSQQHSPQPQQQILLAQQQQPHMLIKQESMNNFLHAAIQQSSMEAGVSTSTDLNQQQSSSSSMQSRVVGMSNNHHHQHHQHHHQRSLSSASNSSNSITSGYGNQNLPFDEDQERKKLERKRARNRMAASKCRQRKLERINELEEQVRMFQEEGAILQNQIQHLKQEVIELNETINRHRSAGCSINIPFKVSN